MRKAVVPHASTPPPTKPSFSWADEFIPAVTAVLADLAQPVSRVQVLQAGTDPACAADFLLAGDSGTIACRLRVRTTAASPIDFTLRCERAPGVKSEAQRIAEGAYRFYFLGWCELGELRKWALIDLDRCRAAAIFSRPWPAFREPDQTRSLAIPLKRIDAIGALLAKSHTLEVVWDWL